MAQARLPCFIRAAMTTRPLPPESRRRQLIGGLAALGFVAMVVLALWLGRLVPGFLGEWFGIVAGIATTPILMEASLIVLGFLVVMTINAWRNYREGDELVFLDRVEGDGCETLPRGKREVIYREKPLDPVTPDAASRLEGALEIRDHDSALEILAEMDDSELDAPGVLELRIRLAEATGRDELANRLRMQRTDH